MSVFSYFQVEKVVAEKYWNIDDKQEKYQKSFMPLTCDSTIPSFNLIFISETY